MTDLDEPLIEYPVNFPITVIGKNEADFMVFVVEILQRHFPELEQAMVSSHLSRNGNYLSVRANIIAESREHLRAAYQDLSSHKRVIMVL
jgi:uncharacterized protein